MSLIKFTKTDTHINSKNGAISTIKCVCGDVVCDLSHENQNSEDKLYFCDQKGCDKIIYCDECIVDLHKFSKKKNKYKKGHKLDMEKTTCISDLSKLSKLKLVKFVAQQTYNEVISPLLSTGKGLTQLGTTGGILYWEYAAIVQTIKSGATFTTKNVLKGTAGVSLAMFGIEIMANAIQLGKGNITRREFIKRSIKSGAQSILIGVGTTMGVYGGGVMGASIGSVAGPPGAFIGGLAGFLIAALASYGASKGIDYMFGDDEEKKRLEAIDEALKWFHFKDKNVIMDSNKFNKKILRRIYKNYLLVSHPDRQGGSKDKFIALQTYYGILVGLCDNNYKQNKRLIKALPKSKLSI